MTIVNLPHELRELGLNQNATDFENFNPEQQKAFIADFQHIDIGLLQRQIELLHSSASLEVIKLDPLHIVDVSGSTTTRACGWEVLRNQPVGCLLVAGGQGSRLGFNKPKGLFPISPIKHKTLFQLFAERMCAICELSGQAHRLAITVAAEFQDDVTTYFASQHHFGLDSSQVAIIPQNSLPVLSEKGDILYGKDGHIIFAPDGNGSSVASLVSSPNWIQWRKQGVDAFTFCQVDNALMDPLDVELIGLHAQNGADVTIKCIRRDDPEESVGILAEREGRICVVEYTEIDPLAQKARNDDGSLLYAYANISAFCFSASFAESCLNYPMPLHVARKTLPHTPEVGTVCKFERFIFDLLPAAAASAVIEYPRRECFAPLKQADGPHSPDAVRQQLIEFDKQVYSNLTDEEAPEGIIELDPKLHYVERQPGLSLCSHGGYVSLASP